ncbi:hypothetical protein V2J09_022308 [Rumex salicifolius]
MTANSSSSSGTMPIVAKSDEETVEVLDRMLTRLALCDDSKLEGLISKLLPSAISSLSGNSLAVRNKVVEILTHVNKRVKHDTNIALPLSELWNIYEANAAPLVRNFCIIYIEMAFERALLEEKKNMAPKLLANISKLPPQHQEIVLRACAKVIGDAHSREFDDGISAKYKTINGSQDSQLFLEFCLQCMLYQPTSQGGKCPAGLSFAQAERVSGKKPLTYESLQNMKLGLLNVISSMELAAEIAYPIYLAACVDSQEAVVKKGEELLKRKCSVTDFDDSNLTKQLFFLFNGNAAAENITPELKVVPVNSALKAKIMYVFCRSITAANSFPSTLQCIFSCIYGIDTTSRLKQLGMEFAFWVFKHARNDQLKVMGPLILNGILKSLDNYGSSEADSIARQTKTFAFQGIGKLAERMPQLFRDKIDIAVRLFNALKSESQPLRIFVQEAANSLATAYKVAPANILKDLEKLLLENCQLEQDEVRFCVMRWATSIFGLQHCPSRFLCMVGAADPRLDIREMATQGLFPAEGQLIAQNLDMKYPHLQDMLDYITKMQPRVLDSSEMRGQKLLFPSQTYVAMIKFLLRCFEVDLLANCSKEAEFLCYVERFCSLTEHALAIEGSVELHAIASQTLIVITSHFSEMLAIRYASKISWLRQLLSHLDLDTREAAARLMGIASSALPVTKSSLLIGELISVASGSQKSRFEVQHGALCALGYLAADCISRSPQIHEAILQNTLQCLVNVVNSEVASLASTAMQALGHIGLRDQLPMLVSECDTVNMITAVRGKLSKLLAGDDTKAIQKIIISLGHVCFKESSASHINMALELVFSLCRSKVEDVLFAAGEALAFLWGSVPVTADMILKTNYTSLSMSSNLLTGEVSPSWCKELPSGGVEASNDTHTIIRDSITRKIFDDLIYSNRKEERCSGTVWLLSLTLYCGHHPKIQQLLPEIQEAFSHLLGEHNELTQELASQGMSLVYELGDDVMKKNLVNALVSTLTGSGKRKRAVKLVEDSEVFQEGSMGESPTGGKLSTYKELCGLANEMGQPDLIYKFMDLANYQASMNSKRGVAFGFSRIAKHAGDALKPHLRTLIPRLVRYQYDPDKNVQDAMAHIWKALVADSKSTIDDNLDLIIEDLLTQSGSRLWRSRESSCLALADILQGRKFEHVNKHLKRIWIVAFRAMDDIKETVRTSGEKLCRAVSSLTIRLCDVSLTEKSEAGKTMDIILPLLLKDGIMSKVDSIRKASIAVVMKLAKGAGIALRPHLSDLVGCMLESLSSLEDQGLNYVELHAANVGIQTDKLENLRISIAKGSPMWETLELCIDAVDMQSLDLLVPRLAQMVRSGVGLNTRVGVATFITLLVQRVNLEIKPYTTALLRLLFPAVVEEKSGAAKRSFASACAVVMKYSTPLQAQKLIVETTTLQVGDRNSQVSCALLLKSYSSLAADVVSGYQAIIIPTVFISRFDDDKQVSSLFEELWEENTSGDRITLQLYLGEIVSLIGESITTSSWASKKKAAQAITKLGEVLGESLSGHDQILLNYLMKELPGRLWEGKESLLHAIAAVCSSCHDTISARDANMPNAVLSLIIKAFHHPQFFNMVFIQFYDMCQDTPDKNVQGTMDTSSGKSDSEVDDHNHTSYNKIIDCITCCIHAASINDILLQKQSLMNVVSRSLAPATTWIVKISGFSFIKMLCTRMNETTPEDSLHASVSSFVHELFISVPPEILQCIHIVKIGQVHVSASECLLQLFELFKTFKHKPAKELVFKSDLVTLIDVEKNEQAKSLLKSCLANLEAIETDVL